MASQDDPAEVNRCAETVAARLTATAASFLEASRTCDAEYRDLLRAVSRLDARVAFDRDGRPTAIDAVRAALPVVESDLFDAILEDHACELAAVEEALYRVALALVRRTQGTGGRG